MGHVTEKPTIKALTKAPPAALLQGVGPAIDGAVVADVGQGGGNGTAIVVGEEVHRGPEAQGELGGHQPLHTPIVRTSEVLFRHEYL